jgi:hypothetical protein
MPDLHGRDQFDRTYQLLRRRLSSGHYRPGERIGVKVLAADLHVSQTPVREALSRLVGQGLVHDRRGNGYYVARLDANEIAGLYALRVLYLRAALQGGGTAHNLGRRECDPDPGTDIEGVFDAILQRNGNAVLIAAARNAAERLSLVRQVEAAVFADLAVEQGDILQVARAGSLSDIRRGVVAYHRRRERAAFRLASALNALMCPQI